MPRGLYFLNINPVSVFRDVTRAMRVAGGDLAGVKTSLLPAGAGISPAELDAMTAASTTGEPPGMKVLPIQGLGVGHAPRLPLQQLAAMGCNAIRCWGTDQLDVPLLEECERLGIAVFAGLWLDSADAPSMAAALGALQQQVRAWQRFACIACWIVGNEVELRSRSEADAWEFIRRAALAVREADPAQRPVATAIADVGVSKARDLQRVMGMGQPGRRPTLDLLLINSYGAAGTLPERLAAQGYFGAYAVGEFAGVGHWEAPAQPVPLQGSGAAGVNVTVQCPVEPSSAEKAATAVLSVSGNLGAAAPAACYMAQFAGAPSPVAAGRTAPSPALAAATAAAASAGVELQRVLEGAHSLGRGYNARAVCVGSFAFYGGCKREVSSTWYSLLLTPELALCAHWRGPRPVTDRLLAQWLLWHAADRGNGASAAAATPAGSSAAASGPGTQPPALPASELAALEPAAAGRLPLRDLLSGVEPGTATGTPAMPSAPSLPPRLSSSDSRDGAERPRFVHRIVHAAIGLLAGVGEKSASVAPMPSPVHGAAAAGETQPCSSTPLEQAQAMVAALGAAFGVPLCWGIHCTRPAGPASTLATKSRPSMTCVLGVGEPVLASALVEPPPLAGASTAPGVGCLSGPGSDFSGASGSSEFVTDWVLTRLTLTPGTPAAAGHLRDIDAAAIAGGAVQEELLAVFDGMPGVELQCTPPMQQPGLLMLRCYVSANTAAGVPGELAKARATATQAGRALLGLLEADREVWESAQQTALWLRTTGVATGSVIIQVKA